MARRNKASSVKPRRPRKAAPDATDPSGFWQAKTIEQLASEQGVQPVGDAKELHGDFWPTAESTDDFLAWLQRLRRESKGDQ